MMFAQSSYHKITKTFIQKLLTVAKWDPTQQPY